jgi:flagellar protein FliS
MLCSKQQALYAYTQTRINSIEHPLDPVIMLYESSIEALGKAVEAIREKDIQRKIRYIDKAIAILEGLLSSLNTEVGGEIALNLQELYLYMIKELTTANLKNDLAKIEHVTTLLRELKEAWTQIRLEFKSNR